MSRQSSRSLTAGVIGTIVEWYDFTIYASFAAVLGAQFFPSQNATASVLAVFATFGIAFLVRPLGGVFFGHVGDRIGRKKTLAASVLLMSGASAAIGLLPTYAAIGVAAPILLMIARCAQGFAVGGELSGAMAYVVESAAPGRRGLMSSLVTASTVLGVVLATLVALVLNASLGADAVSDWAWRIPFLIAGPLGAVGLWLRISLDESPDFAEARRTHGTASSPIVEALRTQVRPILLVFAWIMTQSVAFYLLIAYLVTYMTTTLEMTRGTALFTNMVAAICFGLSCPVFGLLADRIGRRAVLAGGLATLVVGVVPLFALMSTGSFAAVLVAQCLFGVVVGAVATPTNVLMIELFPVTLRYSGSSLGYNAAQMLFGGTAAFVATALVATTGNALSPAYYLCALAAVSLVVAVVGLRRWAPVEVPSDPVSPVDGPKLTATDRP